jgi:hypothetical protein
MGAKLRFTSRATLRIAWGACLLMAVCAGGGLRAADPSEAEQEAQKVERERIDLWNRKDYSQAVRLLEGFLASPSGKAIPAWERAGYEYNLACAQALIGQPDSALAALSRAVDSGLRIYQTMEKDTDLESIRDRPQFAVLLAKVQERGDYAMILRKHAAYDTSEVANPPRFRYQAAGDSNLQRLRQKYDLDSIAGDGDEISRIVNLMRWVHGQVRHDGGSTNPAPRNSLHLLQVCREEDRGINCRMMATILNEAYLAMGYPSRHVTCSPADTTDPDCHVVTLVYSRALGKWVAMDPTFAGYFSDPQGTLLGIAEVRARLAAGQQVQVAQGLDWNGSAYDPAQYLNYITKNFYCFTCPLASEFGYESEDVDREYVVLKPATAAPVDPPAPQKGADGRTISFRVIRNPKLFWAAPS